MNNSKRLPGLGHNRSKQSEKERSKSYNERKKEAGYRKVWVDPATLGRIDDLGSIEEVSARHADLERHTREQFQIIEELEEAVRGLAKANLKLDLVLMQRTKKQKGHIEGLERQAQEQTKKISELEVREQTLSVKNTELERVSQERAGLIADQMADLENLRDNLEAERNRTLLDRLMSSLFGK